MLPDDPPCLFLSPKTVPLSNESLGSLGIGGISGLSYVSLIIELFIDRPLSSSAAYVTSKFSCNKVKYFIFYYLKIF